MTKFKKFVISEMIFRYVTAIGAQWIRHKKPEWFRSPDHYRIEGIARYISESDKWSSVKFDHLDTRINNILSDIQKLDNRISKDNPISKKTIAAILADQKSLHDEQARIAKWQSQMLERIEYLEGKVM